MKENIPPALIDPKAEYDLLNREISENSNKVYQVVGLCVTATAALLLLGPKGDLHGAPFADAFYPFAALLPFAVILPSVVLIESSLHATVRIATYIKVVHERYGGPSWQTDMQNSRDHPDCPARRSSASYQGLFWFLIGACVAVSLSSFLWTALVHFPIKGREPWPRWAVTFFSVLYGCTLYTLVRVAYTLLAGMLECFHRETFVAWEKAWMLVVNSPRPNVEPPKPSTWSTLVHILKWWVMIERSLKPHKWPPEDEAAKPAMA